MNSRLRALILLCSFLFSVKSFAETTTEVICSFAPSQSAAINRISSLAGGSSLGAEITLLANGLTIVPHSSGSFIMTGSGGYVAGTMTGSVITAKMITAGVFIAGTTILVELACVPINHRELVAKLMKDSSEYPSSANDLLKSASIQTKYVPKSTLEEITDTLKRYKTITKDKFYELIGETWYERAIRKTKEAFTD